MGWIAPGPRRGQGRRIRMISRLSWALVGIVLLAALSGGHWLYREYQREMLTATTSSSTHDYIDYIVEPGSSLNRVAHDLNALGLVRTPFFFILAAWKNGWQDSIQAGEYRFLPGVSPLRILEQMAKGKVLLHKLTIQEGWNFRQLMYAVYGHPMLMPTLAGLPGADIMQALGAEGAHPEGQFYPDTYLFPRGTHDVTVLRLAYREMQEILAAEWQERRPGLPLENPYEALILASIVETEALLAVEQPRIAGVFIRRLHKGMRLQADPTVIYAMGEGFNRRLRRRHMDVESPYNTYRNADLPPTPIALPSRSALRAVLHPEDGTALYFLARGDGGHYFSDTLEEHNRYRAELKWRRQKERDRP